ncbi:MAG: squalene--hopene cyclase [Nitrospinota bacterium]
MAEDFGLSLNQATVRDTFKRRQDAAEAIERARKWILDRQDPEEGYWVGELEADTTLTSDYLMLRAFLGTLTPKIKRKAGRYLEMTQLPDGGWNTYRGGPSEINATVKAYFGLKLAGHKGDEPILVRAREAVRRLGGLERTNVFTKMYLALHGQFDWDHIPSMPVELIFAPKWLYINIYEFSYWTRTIIVPLFIIAATKQRVQTLPPGALDDLYVGRPSKRDWFQDGHQGRFLLRSLFLIGDSVLKFLEKKRISEIRTRAIQKAEEWILARHHKTEGLGAIFPAMANAIMALKVLGYEEKENPILAKALRDFEALVIEEEDHLRVQPCLSPVWDTALTCYSLIESGLSGEHPALVKAAQWLLGKQTRLKGDWQVKGNGAEPGGWYFQFENEFYPDNDDTSVVLIALQRIDVHNGNAMDEAIKRGLGWVMGMQGSDGGWGAFERNNNKTILNNIPYADHGAVLDPSTSDLTGRVLELLGRFGHRKDSPAVRRGIRFLKREQEPDGCWYGRWGVNYIYGTHLALQGLASVREDMSAPYVRKAVRWLIDHQNEDGGWGETCASYADPSLRGQGPSTPSQTAWGILGLLAAGEVNHPAVHRGIDFLLDRQTPEGTWEEEEFTGTGFPKVFYLRYHYYRHYFPLAALGRFHRLSS